jgi:hypothetical protein
VVFRVGRLQTECKRRGQTPAKPVSLDRDDWSVSSRMQLGAVPLDLDDKQLGPAASTLVADRQLTGVGQPGRSGEHLPRGQAEVDCRLLLWVDRWTASHSAVLGVLVEPKVATYDRPPCVPNGDGEIVPGDTARGRFHRPQSVPPSGSQAQRWRPGHVGRYPLGQRCGQPAIGLPLPAPSLEWRVGRWPTRRVPCPAPRPRWRLSPNPMRQSRTFRRDVIRSIRRGAPPSRQRPPAWPAPHANTGPA